MRLLLLLLLACAPAGRIASAETMSNLREEALAARIAGENAKQELEQKLERYWLKLSFLDAETLAAVKKMALGMIQVSAERRRYTEAKAVLRVDEWIKAAASTVPEAQRERFLSEAGPLFDGR